MEKAIKAMSTTQATLQHACQECRSGGNCDWDCVLSATCSWKCKNCNERLWFTGNLDQAPLHITCFKCGRVHINEFKGDLK